MKTLIGSAHLDGGVVPVGLGDRVKKTGGDYTYRGVIVGIIEKKSGAVRIVVENDDGLLFIFSPGQLRPE